MTIVLSLLGAILGAILGGIAGFFAIIGLGLLTGADNQQGALAMGAGTVGLPVGAVAGMILGAVIVVRLRSARSPPDAGSGQPNAPSVDAGEGAPRSKGRTLQAWVSIGLVLVCAAAFWTWFNWSGDPPQFWGSKRPVLFAEIRIPNDDPDIAAAVARGTDIRNGNVYHGVDGRIATEEDGPYVRLKLRHTIAYRTDDRSLELWLGQKRLLIFDLDLPAKPPAQERFSDWRRVDHVRPNFYGEEIPPPEGGFDIWVRTQIVWRN